MTKKPLRWKIAQKVELAWWKRYLNDRDKTEYLHWKAGYWKDLIRELPPEFRATGHQKVLDAGCGPAGVFMVLPNCDVLAIDPLLNSYAENLPHFDEQDYPWVTFDSIPLEEFRSDDLFDTVYCMNAINHVKDLELACDVLCEAVKSNGRLIVSIDAHNHGLFKSLFRLIPGDVLHPHQYDLAEYRQMFADRGIQITGEVRLKSEFFFDHYVLAGTRL